jgi:hypothetical protein
MIFKNKIKILIEFKTDIERLDKHYRFIFLISNFYHRLEASMIIMQKGYFTKNCEIKHLEQKINVKIIIIKIILIFFLIFFFSKKLFYRYDHH